ncbi:MAG: OmpA family protein, partial [Bacteroidia bacterium]|nr:OmpA family protein [Bacteroidia bacterium]
SEDQCPDVAGIAALKGCPDKDGDGIADHKDDCPDEAGLPKLRGCPDKDGDGIADKNDKCPDIAGIAANNGCPEIKKEEKEVIDMAVKGVEFKIGSTELTPESFKLLDPMADILVRKQMYKIDIAGHTDNIGDAKINLKLSQDRANAVAKYLLSKGVPAEQIISNGYGDTKPIVPNDTEEGRQKNRRVEFKIVF